jgi:hypothetical protein
MPTVELLRLGREDKDYNQTSRSQTFYGQSWNIVHYWKLSGRPVASRIGHYIDDISSGKSVDESLRSAFPDGTTELDKELRDYSRRTKLAYFEFELKEFPDDNYFESLLKPADGNAVSERLIAWVATHGLSTPGALEYLQRAHETSKGPNTAAVAMATLALGKKEPTASSASAIKACDDDAGSAFFHNLCGGFLSHQARSAADRASALLLLERAYFHYRQAYSKDRDDYNSLVFSTFLIPPGHPDRAILIREFEAVLNRTPSLSVAAYALSRLYADSNLEKAVAYAQQGLKFDFVPARASQFAKMVQQLQAELDNQRK